MSNVTLFQHSVLTFRHQIMYCSSNHVMSNVTNHLCTLSFSLSLSVRACACVCMFYKLDGILIHLKGQVYLLRWVRDFLSYCCWVSTTSPKTTGISRASVTRVWRRGAWAWVVHKWLTGALALGRVILMHLIVTIALICWV